MSVPSHPLKPFALAIGLNRLYEARSFNIKPFSERAKAVLNDADLNNINIQENNILAFPPWDIPIFNYSNPFSGYHKAGTADVIYQQLFSFHRKSLHFLTKRRHPTVIEILLLLRKLERKGFDIIFSLVPGHVGILGNEQADTAARSMSDHMQRPVCYQDLKAFTQNYIHRVWQETWDQQILNKLHSIHPSTSHWAALRVRRHDVRLTRLRIGHTRFTHRHLLLGENAPECPSKSLRATVKTPSCHGLATSVQEGPKALCYDFAIFCKIRLRAKNLTLFGGGGGGCVMENTRARAKFKGPKPKYVLHVSLALDPLESLPPFNAGIIFCLLYELQNVIILFSVWPVHLDFWKCNLKLFYIGF
ncbi:putative RNA-directed DNA polymerase from transposon X-element [Trichonephila clavipes]|nr:putative RNA-directed DNA polymerase from transposon X-element [Trichonephila clavipes]